MKNLFMGITTLEELKRTYRKLAFMYHPDHGGNLEQMKELNNQYEELFNTLKNAYNEGKTEDKQMHECPAEFVDIMMNIMDLEGLEIELCGSWVWVSGNTKEHKDILKQNGFMWASKKCMWYWRSPEDAQQNRSRKGTSMDDIRTKYGSDKIVIKPTLK